MNQKFINNRVINCLVLAGLLAASLQVNAAGFHEGLNNKGIAISATKFNEVLVNTSIEQLGYNFGAPDEIQRLNDTFGDRVGSVWVYHSAVQKDGNKRDAHFVIINGKLQYATLSDAT